MLNNGWFVGYEIRNAFFIWMFNIITLFVLFARTYKYVIDIHGYFWTT